ncbi:MAG TPA: TetR/AcrR family transcriptional regulator [Bryobacteraceae bacterium]|nr:TetR/AcrR family transcriptional regulator [Bryobacteraceae bacterium]
MTKARIVARAAPIFNKRGFEGTSLSELMTATGLQKGGIYRHFKNKEELAVAAFEHAWRCARRERWLGIDKTAGAVDQLKQFVANFIEKRSGLVSGGCPILNTAVDCDDGNPALRDQARKALALWTKRLRAIVKAGLAKGEIGKDADADHIATVIVSTLEGALMMARLQRSDRPLQHAREHLDEFLASLAA